jgi:predicted DsbA family dithiol-disulfide isomerase
VNVEIWSDVACPWCYIGKRRFDVALSRFGHREQVDVRWRSFELDPSAPAVRDQPYLDRLAAKYRIQNGVVLRFDKAKPANTFDAHRLLHLAAEHGVQSEMKERLMRAMFTKGAEIADPDVLVAVAEDVGLDAGEARAVVGGDRFADEVRADERRAADLGITSVPFFVMGGLGVSGAQPPDVLLELLEEAWAGQAPQSS